MKKKIFAASLATIALSAGILSGCSMRSISSIEKTDSQGEVDYYTITYTDGSTSTYTVTNGKDGKDGKDGIDSGVSIASFEKTSSEGLTDFYTVTFTDGRKQTISINNGKDGEDAPSVSITDIYNQFKEQSGEDISFSDFLREYLSYDGFAVGSSDAVKSCLLSSMKVFCAYSKTYYDRNGNVANVSATSSIGSGVIYKMEGEYSYIITNYHVVYNNSADNKISNDIHVFMYGSESKPVNAGSKYTYDSYAIDCDYVGGAIEYDIAVIKAKTADILKINPQACAASVASGYQVGEKVYAIGNTEDEGISVTSGIISVDREAVQISSIDGVSRIYRSLRTDAMIYNGNSGGGLFNEYGQLIGINHAGSTSLNFVNNAIPVQIFTGVADGIMYYSNAEPQLKGTKRLLLGIVTSGANTRYVYDKQLSSSYIVDDVTIDTVNDGLAKNLGLREGDVVRSIEINGTVYEVYRFFHLGDYLLNVRSGDEVVFNYERAGVVASTQKYTVKSDDLINLQ